MLLFHKTVTALSTAVECKLCQRAVFAERCFYNSLPGR